MDNNILLDLVAKLGYRLAMSGAETFRVEESINRILTAYELKAETFVIPNCMIISVKTAEGQSLTRMRRIGQHGNDLDSVERYSNLSRRICAETPDPTEAMKWLKETDLSRVHHSLPVNHLGHLAGAAGFAIFFGGGLLDAICAGFCGMLVGIISHFSDKWKINTFFNTTVAAFAMTILAILFGYFGVAANTSSVIIGALMILVPGLLFTNAMRDIIFGDTNSGINRIVQVFLIAVAIALGTGAAWSLSSALPGSFMLASDLNYHNVAIELIAAMIGCFGFTIIFNIHFPGGLFCVLGGVITWGAYSLCIYFNISPVVSNFFAAVVAAIYAEIMARIRKYPAISYLVVSCFPLLPGAGVFYTTYHIVQGDMVNFAVKGKETIAIAGVLAVGILLVSTIFRFLSIIKTNRLKSPK